MGCKFLASVTQSRSTLNKTNLIRCRECQIHPYINHNIVILYIESCSNTLKEGTSICYFFYFKKFLVRPAIPSPYKSKKSMCANPTRALLGRLRCFINYLSLGEITFTYNVNQIMKQEKHKPI